MFDVSRFQLRMACVVAAILYFAVDVSMWAGAHGYLGAIARDAGAWRHQGLWVPVWLLSLFGLFHLVIFVSGLVGMFMFKRWGRRLLVAALVVAFVAAPLGGEAVYSPLAVLLASAFSLLHMWMIVVAFWSPQGHAWFAKSEGFVA